MSITSETKGGGFKLRSFWGAVLAISLILNAFVITHILGRTLFGPPSIERMRGDPIRAFLRDQPNLKEQLREQRAAARGQIRPIWDRIHKERGALHQMMGAETLDVASIEARQKMLRTQHQERRRLTDARMLAFVQGLSVEERQAFSAFLAERAAARRAYWLERRKREDAR